MEFKISSFQLAKDTIAFLESCKSAEKRNRLKSLRLGYDVYFGYFIEKDKAIFDDLLIDLAECNKESVYVQSRIKDFVRNLNPN